MPAQNKNDFEKIRSKLKFKHLNEKADLQGKHELVVSALKEKGLDVDNLRQHSAKLLGAGAMMGAFLLPTSTDMLYLPTPQQVVGDISDYNNNPDKSMKNLLVDNISSLLPKKPRPLSRNEEKVLEQIFKNVMGVNARATLEGEHLNTTYGYIGAEQHLYRFPGDTLSQHGEGQILKEGIAPGLGAWGYFAPSKSQMTTQLEEIEKWYAVVQTLYLPDWNTRQPYLKNWYKYRKVLIVNTENGNAVIASIADSGPAAWTGKHYGGSPEVMDYLGGPRYKKGPVIIFFVDDPNNEVKLGPVEYQNNELQDYLVNNYE